MRDLSAFIKRTVSDNMMKKVLVLLSVILLAGVCSSCSWSECDCEDAPQQEQTE